MKRLVALLLLSTPVFASQARDATTAPVAVGQGVIAGVVVPDGTNGSPVRRAIVTLAGPELGGPRKTVTDDQGRFAIRALPAGQFTLSAEKAGWVTTYFGSTHPGRPVFGGSPLVLKAGQQMTNVTLRLVRGGVITGTVTDPFGRPTSGVFVQAIATRVKDGRRVLEDAGFSNFDSTQSDDRGVYRLFGLTPGDYVIAVQPGSLGRSQMLEVQQTTADIVAAAKRAVAGSPVASAASPSGASREATIGYVDVFYPGVVDRSAASILSVHGGEELPGIDIRLQLLSTMRVSGVVNGPDGQPVAGAQLELVSSDLAVDALTADRVARSGPDGRFQINSVAPSAYDLVAYSFPAPSGRGGGGAAGGDAGSPDVIVFNAPGRGSMLWAQQAVTVARDDVTGITLNLQPGATVTGHVVFAGTPPATPQDLTRTRVTLRPESSLMRYVTNLPVASVDASGTFRIPGVPPGRYRVTAQQGAGRAAANSGGSTRWIVQSAMVGEIDAIDRPFDVSLNAAVPDLTVTFTDHLGEVSGAVTDGQGHAVSSYRIVVFAADRVLWGTTNRRIREPVATDADGVFRVDKLPAGRYLLSAVTDIDSDDLENPTFLEDLAAKAIPFTIGDGEKKVLNIKPGGSW